jgi:apolipoprotein N-acyltransferase
MKPERTFPSPSREPPTSPTPSEPPWRPSRVGMTRRLDDTVAPRRGMVALPALAAGVGLALSLPPFGFWILAFPAAGLLWWRIGGLRARTRFWAGWLAGLGCYVPGLIFVRAFTLPGALVLMAIEAAFVAVGCLAVPPGPVVARALVFPAALTLAEAARMIWPFGGLPIGGVFLGQADGPVLGAARLGGPLLLTAIVYLGGVGVGALATAAARGIRDAARVHTFARAEVGGPGWWPAGTEAADRVGILSGALAGTGTLVTTGVVALVLVALVATIADHAPDGGPSIGAVSTAAVQGGGAHGVDKSQVHPAQVLAAQMAASRRLQVLDGGHAPELVLWPEDVVSLDEPLSQSPEESVLSALAATLHTTLVVGVTANVSTTAFRNEVVAWGPDGTLVARFEKVHRVPFGEYVPYRSLFAHVASLSSVPLDAIPGTGSGLMQTPAAPLGAMVSFEVFYASRGRSSVRAGAQLLVVPTNTASYATSQVPTQELAAATIQAVQQGRDLLQAAPTGFSAAIDHLGALEARSTIGARQVIFATLDRRTGSTLYVRFGDVPVLLLAAVALLPGWWIAVRRRGHQGSRWSAWR